MWDCNVMEDWDVGLRSVLTEIVSKSSIKMIKLRVSCRRRVHEKSRGLGGGEKSRGNVNTGFES